MGLPLLGARRGGSGGGGPKPRSRRRSSAAPDCRLVSLYVSSAASQFFGYAACGTLLQVLGRVAHCSHLGPTAYAIRLA